MNRVLNFAYGSNLSIDRLQSRVGNVTVVGTYHLQDYELYFTNSGFANIRPNKGSIVSGVLYELTPLQHKILNRYEAFYIQEYFIVNGEIVNVYVESEDLVFKVLRKMLPTPEYLNYIIEGAIHFGLINLAKQMDNYKIKTLKLKKYKRFNYENK